MPFRTLAFAAIVAGLALTWSPLTVLCALVLVALIRWAARDLAGAERRLVIGVLVAAIAVRVAIVLALFLTADVERHQVNTLFPDGMPTIARSWWIRNLWMGVPIGPFYTVAVYDPYGASSYFYLLAFVQTLVGPAPYALALLNTTVFLAGAVALFRLARHAYGGIPAAFGLTIVLFMPTLVLWSVSVLKDPMHFGIAGLVVYAAFRLCRAEGLRARVLPAAGAALGLLLLSGLRSGALVIAVAGIALGLLLRAITLRWSTAVAAAAAGLVLAVAAWNVPALQARAWEQLQLAANRHMGHARTEGASYRVLDQRFYSEGFESVFTMTGAEGARFVIRSLAAVVLVPLPWESSTRTTLALIPQQVVWYLVAVLAVVGLPSALRRDALLTCLLVSYAAIAAGVIALNSGNVGTFIRYRDMVVPFVVWFGGCGASAAAAWSLGALRTWKPAEVPA